MQFLKNIGEYMNLILIFGYSLLIGLCFGSIVMERL